MKIKGQLTQSVPTYGIGFKLVLVLVLALLARREAYAYTISFLSRTDGRDDLTFLGTWVGLSFDSSFLSIHFSTRHSICILKLISTEKKESRLYSIL